MLNYAPDPILVGGVTAVPISIQSVTAVVQCDCTTTTATAAATMVFSVGPNSGRPIFDLRQMLSAARLDGVALATSDLSHRTLNGDSAARMRIMDRNLTAGSTHTLELEYEIGQPASTGAVPLGWQTSPRGLTWDFWFTDLSPGRYLEMWFPANLVYDEHELTIDLTLNGAQTTHTLVTNASVTNLAVHRWLLEWPATTSSFGPLLYLTPASKLVSQTSTVTMPSGDSLTLELHKQTTVGAALSTLANSLESWLIDFENDLGEYTHNGRFVALVWDHPTRSMEYDGATTSNVGSLKHETFHSWIARGVKPARQADSWLDEALTVWFADNGAGPSLAFDFSNPPVALRFADPWRRHTPGASYSKGRDFFSGLADEFGLANLKQYLRELYDAHTDRGLSTEELAAFLIERSGRVDLLDYFHHFVYGRSIPAFGPDLYLRDAPSDTGATPFGGQFWRSPDVWVRNQNDAGTTHQDPEFGQDNWFYARVRNRSSVASRLFGVTFTVKTFAGTQFVYPGDWAPFLGVAVADGVAANATRIVAARWPAAAIPPEGTHGCLLAQVYTPDDPAPIGPHVWEHNNLAQRNLTIVDLVPGDSTFVPLRLGSTFARQLQHHRLELSRTGRSLGMEVALAHPKRSVLERLVNPTPEVRRPIERARAIDPAALRFIDPARVSLLHGPNAVGIRFAAGSTLGGARPGRITPTTQDRQRIRSFAGQPVVEFSRGERASIPIELAAGRPLHASLLVTAPRDSRPGETFDLDLVERDSTGTIVGGMGIQIRTI